MVSISSAAARDDIYDLTELAFASRMDPVKIAKIAEALEESIPRLDPVRFRAEFEHVLAGPDLPQLSKAKDMAKAALEGRLVAPQDLGAERPHPDDEGFMARVARLLRGQARRPSR